MSQPVDGPPPGLRELQVTRIAELVLGDPAVFTREEAAAAAGLTVEQARPYWRAMGFADVGSAPAFTATDVGSLILLTGWVTSGMLDEATTIEVVRSLGQTASRLADWQVDTMARVLAESEEPLDLAAVEEGMAAILPGLESLLVHAWRRHLAAVISRGLAFVADDPASAEPTLATVGFADIAGFTRLARVMADEDLARMVQAFESGAADIVAGRGARLVKTLGDEVMFVADSADDAIAIAVQMHELSAPGDEVLTLRIGLATGHLISRMGDFYGGTVNLASRLTAMARPGSTLIDSTTEGALVAPEPYVLRHLAPRPLRGMGMVRATSVMQRRRAPAEVPTPG
ncbi:MAG TPA: adenylate/guanylate cyclase domain-containing protein [Motilibacterales bacterium]|nr:adenylate/guanylate cyclase domain-containing protein [Motilibacterales bacterium]